MVCRLLNIKPPSIVIFTYYRLGHKAIVKNEIFWLGQLILIIFSPRRESAFVKMICVTHRPLLCVSQIGVFAIFTVLGRPEQSFSQQQGFTYLEASLIG